jgi:hypothetical protein
MADERRRKKQKKPEISVLNNEDVDQPSSGIFIYPNNMCFPLSIDVLVQDMNLK